MKPFLSLRSTRALSAFTFAVVAGSFTACGSVGAGSLFANGGSPSSSSAAGGDGSGGSTSSGASSSSSGASGSASGSSSGASTSSSSSSSASSSGAAGCQAGFTCVDADPTGWAGHYYVTEVNLPAAAAPPCPAGLTTRTDHASPAGPAQCTACTCGNLQGAACAPPDLTCWPGSTTCGGGNGVDLTPLLQDGACHSTAVPNPASQLSCKLTSAATVTAPGSCPPSVSDFPNKESWQQRVDVCGADQPSGTCGNGQVCIPQGAGTPGESLCIASDGVDTCPAGWPKAIVAYADDTDTRACGACACAPNTACGDSHYTFYTMAQCVSAGTAGTQVVGSSNCADVSAEVAQNMGSAKATLPSAKGTCAASGGAPSGSVTPSKPRTYCCQ